MASPVFSMPARLAIVSLIVLAATAGTAFAQKLEVVVAPAGHAAKERPLPVGATPSLAISLRNGDARAVGPIVLTATFDGLAAANLQSWRAEGGALVGEIARLGAGERVERTLRLKVERAPQQAAKIRVRVEARAPDGTVSTAEADLNIADCVGAYRERIGALRPSMLQAVRDAADEMRKPDTSLPIARQFAATGARSGDAAVDERLATLLAARRGADAEMGSEWFRFLIQRWTSELNLYVSQPPHPGLCASNYYQVAGYRQGLLPVTKRLDTIRAASAHALTAAREAAKAESGDDLASIVKRAIDATGLAPKLEESAPTPLAALAAAREALPRDRKLDPEQARALSLAETAAWLDAADRRAQRLTQSIESVLSAIAGAHKESCVCAF